MNFAYGEEQEAFRASLRRFLEGASPPDVVRRHMATPAGYDASLWRRMARELGVAGVAIPERWGGAGFTALELGIVSQELGRTLTCAPLLSTSWLAAGALLASGDDAACARWLPGLADGTATATLAWVEPSGAAPPDGVALAFEDRGGRLRLTGARRVVVDGDTADLVLVVARAPGTAGAEGVTLLAVEGDAPGLTRTRLPALDPTRPLADLRFDGVDATPVGAPGAAWPAVDRALLGAAAGLACEAVAVGERCLEMAVDYARTRVQFARPIGSFQAIQHLCAELLVELQAARALAEYASWLAAGDGVGPEGETLATVAPLALAQASEAAVRAAADSLHVHGGVGFTWEHDVHLYLRRARSIQALLGEPSHQRRRVADALGLGPGGATP